MRLIFDECALAPGERVTLTLTTAEVSFKASGLAFLDPKPRWGQIQVEDVSAGFSRRACTCDGVEPVAFRHVSGVFGCPAEGTREGLTFSVRVLSLAEETLQLRAFLYDEDDPVAILRRARDREVGDLRDDEGGVLCNHLVLVGGVGQRKAYLNVSREEAIRRYREEDVEGLFSASDVSEFDFEDEFWVYDAGPRR